MKRSKLVRLLAAAALLAFLATGASAAPILDSGEPTSAGSIAIDSGQWVAQQFTLDQFYTITDIEGYLERTSEDPGDPFSLSLVGVIRHDNSGLPGTAIRAFSITISAPDTPGWYGSGGTLSAPLGAGVYWMSWETDDSTQYFEGLPYYDAPTPLGNGAYSPDQGVSWINFTPDYGLRVYSDPVPLPASLPLLGSGLVALLWWRRR